MNADEVSRNIVRLMKSRKCRKVVRMEECIFKMLTSEPKGKRRLEKYNRKWKDNIRMNLKEIIINTRN